MVSGSENRETKKIGIGEFLVAKNDAVLKSSGLGSCLGVVIYDGERGIAG